MTLVPNVLVVGPKVDVKTLAEFIELAKRKPGDVRTDGAAPWPGG
jgi:tripartite-type tricarboxylate transporter receptor subunit TctC